MVITDKMTQCAIPIKHIIAEKVLWVSWRRKPNIKATVKGIEIELYSLFRKVFYG